jgi:hypothetical protein
MEVQAAGQAKESKRFFFEKKKQKTFASGGAGNTGATTPRK